MGFLTVSGQLVGEVIAAAAALRKQGLSPRGFQALIAIAEKAQTDTRQGSVRWDHIRGALYGASRRTAERAVQDLRDKKVIDLVEAGYKNGHRSRAPKYEIRPMPDSASQVAEPTDLDSANQVAESKSQIPPNLELDSAKSVSRFRHSGDVLDVYLTEFLDGGPPPRHCPKHMPDGTTDSCPPCGHHRKCREAWDAEFEERRLATRGLIRKAIDDCHDCDQFGKLDDATDCPKHPNFRQYPEFAARAS
jgi:hypothetical protein